MIDFSFYSSSNETQVRREVNKLPVDFSNKPNELDSSPNLVNGSGTIVQHLASWFA